MNFGEKTALRAKAEDRRASWTRPGLGYPLSSCSSAELDSVCPSVVILIDGDNLSIPGGVVFEHGVENDQQLAHASGENDFGLFAASAGIALSQSLSKRSDVFVAAFGGEGGHVQGIPNGGSSSPDGSGSQQKSAVTIEGSDADERSDLLAVELSQFGEVGQEGGGGGGSDARHGGHEVDLVLPVVVITNELFDLILDAFELFFEGFEDVLDALAGGLAGGLFETVGLGGAQIDQLTAAFDELLELSQGTFGHFETAGHNDLTEASQDARVEGVGLGENSDAFGEIPDLAWIDERHGMSGLKEFGDRHAFETAGGFEDDDTGSRFGKLLEQLAETDAIIGDGESLGLGTECDLEEIFGNVHTDVGRLVHGKFPSLRIRARGFGREPTALAAVRAKTKRPTTIMLGFGIKFAEG